MGRARAYVSNYPIHILFHDRYIQFWCRSKLGTSFYERAIAEGLLRTQLFICWEDVHPGVVKGQNVVGRLSFTDRVFDPVRLDTGHACPWSDQPFAKLSLNPGRDLVSATMDGHDDEGFSMRFIVQYTTMFLTSIRALDWETEPRMALAQHAEASTNVCTHQDHPPQLKILVFLI